MIRVKTKKGKKKAKEQNIELKLVKIILEYFDSS